MQANLKSKFENLKKAILEESLNPTPASQAYIKPIAPKRQSLVQLQTCHNVCNRVPAQPQMQQPIILQKKSASFRDTSKSKKSKIKIEQVASFSQTRGASTARATVIKRVEEFSPIEIPQKENKPPMSQTMVMPQRQSCNKEIEIHIEKDEDDKECLKKLFKKVHKLTQQLGSTEKERDRLKLLLEMNGERGKKSGEDDKKIRELDLARHKLELEVMSLKEKLALQKNKPASVVEKLVEKPVEVVKQVPVEKIVQVKIEVPKYIPGPERVVEKIVEVPKYIQVQKKVPVQVIKTVVKEVPREIIKTITVPQYVDKIVYVDKPIYVDKVVEKPIEVPIQVPIEVPIYVDRPFEVRNDEAESQLMIAQNQISRMGEEIGQLRRDNQHLTLQLRELYANIQVLRRHNEQKNREVEALIQSSFEQYNSVPRETIRTVRVPEFIQRPVYIEKKVEIPVQVPIQVPVQVPIYRQSSLAATRQEQTTVTLREEINSLLQKNQTLRLEARSLREENDRLREQNRELFRNLDLLRRHHEQKNKEVEALIQQESSSGYLTKKYTTNLGIGGVGAGGGSLSSYREYSISPDVKFTGRFGYE